MGKATIISGGAASNYTIQIKHDQKRIDTRIINIDALLLSINTIGLAQLQSTFNLAEIEFNSSLVQLNTAIVNYTAETITKKELLEVQKTVIQKKLLSDKALENLNSIKLKKLSLEKEKQYLQNNVPNDEVVQAWCVDFNEALTGDVGTIEIPGQRFGVPVLIKPSFTDNAVYNSKNDGILQYSIASTPEAYFYNLAILPGWQKWMPTFRIGVVSAINYDNDNCTVTLDDIKSSQQSLDVNRAKIYNFVPIKYMGCDSAVFVNGDRVVVQFTGQSSYLPVVIGFESFPELCPSGQLFCVARSDSETADNRFILERTPSWTATSVQPPAYGGNVDWKGKSSDDTLTFNGPQSRYWYTQDDTGPDALIYHNGGILASAPWKVIGVSKMNFSGTDYLNAIIYDDLPAEIKIYQRVWATSYANDNDYDAATNPLGWKLIHTESLVITAGAKQKPATIFACNASGNEFQGIIGNRPTTFPELFDYQNAVIRIKYNISGVAVLKTSYSAKYQYTESHLITIVNNDNPGFTDTCLANINCPASTCSHQQKVTTDDRFYDSETLYNNQNEYEGVICVDYDGDREILGRIVNTGDAINLKESYKVDSTGTEDIYFNCGGETSRQNIISGSSSSTVTLNQTIPRTKFVFDGRSIDLDVQFQHKLTTVSRTFFTQLDDFVVTTATYNATLNYTEDSNSTISDIVFLDMRNDIVSLTQRIEDNPSTGYTVNISDSSGPQPRQYNLTTNRNFRHIVLIKGVEHILNENKYVYSNLIDLGDIATISPGYPASPLPSGTYPGQTNFLDDGSQTHKRLNKEAVHNGGEEQGYGVDFSGNILASQTIWEEEELTRNFTDVGKWDFLSGGNAPVLTGLVGTNPKFWRVSVLK